jgi:hypothetical protein
MVAIPADAKKGFLLVIGVLAALYIGSLVIGKLPS